MILAIDAGNSNVVFGIWGGNLWKHVWRVQTRSDDQSGFFYSRWLSNMMLEHEIHPSDIRRVIVSSVVPDLNRHLQEILEKNFGRDVVIIGPQTWDFVALKIDRPTEIGSDLVCNAVAACEMYKTDCLVVDFGTALTFTSVSKNMELLGVAIAPGLNTAMKALYGNTAQLPEVPVKMPNTVIGKNTEQAIQAGVICGYYGLVERIIAKSKNETETDFKIVATGGLSAILESYYDLFDEVNTHLTLDGLRIIDDMISTKIT